MMRLGQGRSRHDQFTPNETDMNVKDKTTESLTDLQPAPRWRLAVILLLLPMPGLAYLFLDEASVHMAGRWPELLVTIADITSDFVMLVPVLSALALFTGVALTLHSIKTALKGFYAIVSVLIASGITHLLKPLIGRARPTVFDEHGLFGRKAFDGNFDYVSFPSGHATHAGAFFAALAFAFPQYRLLFMVLALWFGFTRIVLGVHYPSDVVTGLLIGTGSALFVARAAAHRGLVFRP